MQTAIAELTKHNIMETLLMRSLHSFSWNNKRYQIEVTGNSETQNERKFFSRLMEEYPEVAYEVATAKKNNPDLEIQVNVIYIY